MNQTSKGGLRKHLTRVMALCLALMSLATSALASFDAKVYSSSLPEMCIRDRAQQPVPAESAPVFEPFQILAGLAEELQLHLLEFPHAEDEVAGGDFVAEGFADLADARGQLFPGGAHGVEEVHENALRRFRPQIQLVYGILGHARMGLEHQVELANASEVLLAAHGAYDVVAGRCV